LNFPDSDRAVFDAHIATGGCFVAARLNPGENTENSKIQSNGLAAPLVFQFPGEKPFYPLALTGTGGHKTEVLLYVLSDQPFSSGGRLPLRFSGKMQSFAHGSVNILAAHTFLETGFQEFSEDLTHLCKFKGVLRPDQMRDDLLLEPAPGQTDFRETVIRW
jgi:hypothetical protein